VARNDFYDKNMALAEAEGRKVMADAAQHIAPQPLGSQPVSTADQHFDWVNRGPDYWQKMLGSVLTQSQTSGGNTGDALIALLKHDAAMQQHGGSQ
jgi:hypothetical protein